MAGTGTWLSGTSRPPPSTSSGTATAPISTPMRASCTWTACWTWARAGCWDSRWASTTTPDLAYGALAMAVAVRGGAVPGVIMHTDQGSEYTAGLFRAACQRLSICQSIGLPGLGAGQRGHRVVALDPGVRAAADRALRDRRPLRAGSRPGSRTTTTTAWHSLAGQGRARWITSGRWREGTPRDRAARRCAAQNAEGGGFAAAPLHQAAALQARGTRAARGYGAAPPASSPSVTAGQPRTVRLPGTRTREDSLDPGDLCGPLTTEVRAGPACPAQGAARPAARAPAHKRTPGTERELAFDSQKKDRNYKNPLSVSVHGSRGLPPVAPDARGGTRSHRAGDA